VVGDSGITIGDGSADGDVLLKFKTDRPWQDGDVLLKFKTDRPWQFEVDGDGSGAQLALRATVGNKRFRIKESGGGQVVEFYAATSSTDRYAKFTGRVYPSVDNLCPRTTPLFLA